MQHSKGRKLETIVRRGPSWATRAIYFSLYLSFSLFLPHSVSLSLSLLLSHSRFFISLSIAPGDSSLSLRFCCPKRKLGIQKKSIGAEKLSMVVVVIVVVVNATKIEWERPFDIAFDLWFPLNFDLQRDQHHFSRYRVQYKILYTIHRQRDARFSSRYFSEHAMRRTDKLPHERDREDESSSRND